MEDHHEVGALYRLLRIEIYVQSTTWRPTTETCLCTLLQIVCDIRTIKVKITCILRENTQFHIANPTNETEKYHLCDIKGLNNTYLKSYHSQFLPLL